MYVYTMNQMVLRRTKKRVGIGRVDGESLFR